MKVNPLYDRTATPTLDFSRIREQSRGSPENYLSYGTVGHYDDTPSYVRVEEGDVLVEVTLAPSGDEVVARLDLGTMDNGAAYLPLSYGQRVVVGFPNAEQGDPVILARLSDSSWPFPDEVGGISTDPNPDPGVRSAPSYAFLKTGEGELVVIETGDGGDIVVRSGGSAQIRVDPPDQVLLTGRTHLGSDAQFSEEPKGAQVGNNGFISPGEQGVGYTPPPNTNSVVPPATYNTPTGPRPLPADGIMRLKDTVQSNVSVDPEFWNKLLSLYTALTVWTPVFGDGGTALKTALAAFFALPTPSTLESIGRTSSQNTASDD